MKPIEDNLGHTAWCTVIYPRIINQLNRQVIDEVYFYTLTQIRDETLERSKIMIISNQIYDQLKELSKKPYKENR